MRPALAGVLVTWIGAATVLLVDCASFLAFCRGHGHGRGAPAAAAGGNRCEAGQSRRGRQGSRAPWSGRSAPSQAGAAAAFLALLTTPNQALVAAGFFAVGLLSAPMTVWAQSLRMRRIPPELHGRAFATLLARKMP